MPDSDQSKDDIPEDFGTSLGGSVRNTGSNIICQVCGMSFPSMPAYQSHFSNSHRK